MGFFDDGLDSPITDTVQETPLPTEEQSSQPILGPEQNPFTDLSSIPPELSTGDYSPVTKYDTHGNIAATIVGGTMATVADIATTTWNSLPFTENVTTHDLLARIDANAMNIYDEHRDTIEAASLVAGSLLPMGLAIKGMGMARAGVKGVSWFSEAGKAEQLAVATKLFEEGPSASNLFKSASRTMYAGLAANAVVDSAVMEGAILATMNAHPLMEDYMKDPVKNFFVSTAIFSALSVPVELAQGAFKLGRATAKVSEEGSELVRSAIKPPETTASLSTQLAQIQDNSRNLSSILEMGTKDGGETLNGYTRTLLKDWIDQTDAKALNLFEEMASPELRSLPIESKRSIMEAIQNDPQKWAGVDRIELAKAKESISFNQPEGALFDSTKINPDALPLTRVVKQGATKGELRGVSVAYSPELGAFYNIKDGTKFMNASDLGLSEKALTANISSSAHTIPRADIGFELQGMSTASRDADHIRWLKYYDKLSNEEVARAKLNPDDIAQMSALLLRMDKMEPADLARTRISLTREHPDWAKVEQGAFARIAEEGAGVKASYFQDIKSFTTGDTYKALNAQYDKTLSSEARQALDLWTEGSGMEELRIAAKQAQTGTATPGAAIINEIYKAPSSVALRAKFLENADSSGNVYLYRGMKTKPGEHAPIESYTTDIEKAKEFGSVKLYKINVNDILTGIQDLVPKNGRTFNEILVKAPGPGTIRDSITVNSIQEERLFTSRLLSDSSKKVSTEATHAELYTNVLAAKTNLIEEMISQGKSMQEISYTTSVPMDTLEHFIASNRADLAESASMGSGLMRYDNAENIKTYLGADRRTLVLHTNMNKIPLAQMRSQLQMQNMGDINKLTLDMVMGTSRSKVAQGVKSYLDKLDTVGQLEMLRADLGKVVRENMGNTFLTSSNFSLRNMGNVGPIVASIGKDVEHLHNTIVKSLVEPVTNSLNTFIKDRAAVTEFNQAVAVNAGLKGYREYDKATGMIMVQDAENPWKLIPSGKVGKNGKPIFDKERNMVPATLNGQPFAIQTATVRTAFEEMQSVGRELYEMQKTRRSLLGQAPLNDMGFWIPPFNPQGKYISFVFDRSTHATTLLHGNTPEELAQVEKAAEVMFVGKPEVEIVRAGKNLDLFNKLQGRHDNMFMGSADISAFHKGSAAPTIVKTNAEVMSEIVNGYDHYIGRSIRDFMDIHLDDIMTHLNTVSAIAKGPVEGQPVKYIQKVIHQPKDVGATVKNTLLGRPNLDQYIGWRDTQNGMKAIAEDSLQTITKVLSPILEPIEGLFGKGKRGLEKDYRKFTTELEARGIVSPFKAFDDALGYNSKEAMDLFYADKVARGGELSSRVVALSNNLMATSMLRFMELAQPLVNAISLPVLTSTAIHSRKAKAFMGSSLDEFARYGLTDTMYNGMRYMLSDAAKADLKYARDNGYLTPMISEVNSALERSRSLQPGLMTTLEKAINSGLVNTLSKPAEWSESFVREYSYATGLYLSKKLYPNLGQAGRVTFARDFMDTAIGNYAAAQRPAVFQGTLGVAMGLFQTYMVTMAQNIYRHVELGEFKSLAKMMLTQSTIFGAQSLPGFHLVSETIGEHFSGQHFDLETGLYRALPKGADLILYGLPSNLGPAVTTRGDIQPRIPNVAAGLDNLAAVNFLKSAVQSGDRLARAAMTADPHVGMAIGEALSLQSISRPIARISELFTGHSITGKGNIVQGPEEVYTVPGIMARVLSTRPTSEVKIREAMHLNTVYGQINHAEHAKIESELKSRLRDGTLDDDKVEQLGERYMRTGSPTGWRSAVNRAMGQDANPTNMSVRKYLDPRSPAMTMIDSLDGE